MIKNYRKILDEKLIEKKLIDTTIKKQKIELKRIQQLSEDTLKVREIFQAAALITQNHLAAHLSLIVTKALNVVFPEKDASFVVKFEERRGTTEADLWVEQDDNYIPFSKVEGSVWLILFLSPSESQ